MNRTEYIKEVAEKAGMTIGKTKDMLNVAGEVLVDHMTDEDGVTPFVGVKFIAVHKDARNTRNPQTGEMMTVPAKIAPKVRFGKAVKEALN